MSNEKPNDNKPNGEVEKEYLVKFPLTDIVNNAHFKVGDTISLLLIDAKPLLKKGRIVEYNENEHGKEEAKSSKAKNNSTTKTKAATPKKTAKPANSTKEESEGENS